MDLVSTAVLDLEAQMDGHGFIHLCLAIFLLQPRLWRIKRFGMWPSFNFQVLCCKYS